ncbi:MAG: hypothetical protein ACUVUG_07990 [Candidatus Aminicenantia bacterium]
MKRLIIFFSIIFFLIPLHARLKFIGPNPYFSFTHFPQDSRFFLRGSSIFFLSYRNTGWMGNLDDPFRSPSALYVNTEEWVEENINGVNARAGFDGKWFNAELASAFYVRDFKGFRIIPLGTFQFDSFSLKANGNAIAHSYDGNQWLIPFSGKVSQRNYTGNIGFLLSGSIKGMPAGMIFNYSRGEESNPEGFIQYRDGGREIRMNRYTWGWSASAGCQKIFGTSTNVDAFWQDSFTDTVKNQIDFVFGMDIKDHKVGIRFRNINIYGDYFSYSRTLDRYLKSEQGEKTTINVLRPYAVFKIKDFGSGKLFGVSVLELDLLKKRPFSKGKEFVNSYNEKKITGEFLPFIHFDFERGFLRFGSGVALGYKLYDYTDIWGKQKVYQPSTPYFDWESSWEHSSYGNEISFISFSEIDTEINLERKMNSTLRVEIWRMLTYYRTKRYYGKNIYAGESYNFFETAERMNTLKEDWLGGTIGVLLGKKFSIGIFLDIPVFYKRSISTEVNGNTSEYFEGYKNFQPAVREPLKFWVMLIWR